MALALPRRLAEWDPRPWAYPLLAVLGANAAVVLAATVGLLPVALAAALLVPVVLAVYQRPQRGLLLLAALAPLDGLLLISPVYVPSGWKQALVVLTVALTFVAPAEARGLPGRRVPTWVPAVVALFVLAVASGAAVGLIQATTGLRLTFFYALAAVAAWRCPLNAKERDQLVTILMVTGFIAAVVGLIQQVLGGTRLNALGYEYNRHIRFAGSNLRSMGTFHQSFGLGFFEMIVLLVGIPHALAEPRRPRSTLFFLCMPIFALGMLASIVRAAWLGFGVGFAYLGARRHPSLLLVIPLCLIGLLFIPPEVSEAALSSESFQQRTTSWGENFDELIQHPLGVGIGSAGSASEKVADIVGTGSASTYQPDNYYFKTIYELGVLGLWLFLLFLVSAFLVLRDASSRLQGRDAAFTLGVSAMVLAAGAAAVTATYFEVFPMDLFFWLLLGVASTLPTEPVANSTPALEPVH